MCDPVTVGLALLGTLGTVSAMSQKVPNPPAAEVPAIAAPTSRNPGATVRLGNSDSDISNSDSASPSDTNKAVETRIAASSLGNLGRSGLAI